MDECIIAAIKRREALIASFEEASRRRGGAAGDRGTTKRARSVASKDLEAFLLEDMLEATMEVLELLLARRQLEPKKPFSLDGGDDYLVRMRDDLEPLFEGHATRRGAADLVQRHFTRQYATMATGVPTTRGGSNSSNKNDDPGSPPTKNGMPQQSRGSEDDEEEEEEEETTQLSPGAATTRVQRLPCCSRRGMLPPAPRAAILRRSRGHHAALPPEGRR